MAARLEKTSGSSPPVFRQAASVGPDSGSFGGAQPSGAPTLQFASEAQPSWILTDSGALRRAAGWQRARPGAGASPVFQGAALVDAAVVVVVQAIARAADAAGVGGDGRTARGAPRIAGPLKYLAAQRSVRVRHRWGRGRRIVCALEPLVNVAPAHSAGIPARKNARRILAVFVRVIRGRARSIGGGHGRRVTHHTASEQARRRRVLVIETYLFSKTDRAQTGPWSAFLAFPPHDRRSVKHESPVAAMVAPRHPLAVSYSVMDGQQLPHASLHGRLPVSGLAAASSLSTAFGNLSGRVDNDVRQHLAPSPPLGA